MRFCRQCESILTKTPLADGSIVFICVCGESITGDAEDTLMFQNVIENDSGLEHQDLIDNSPHDTAAYRVKRECACGLDFMTLIRVGKSEKTMYTCTCGAVERG